MKTILNTLYVTAPDSYIYLDGENVVIKSEDIIKGRIPLHNLESIVTFGYSGASPALMGACVERNVSLSFMTSSGRFLARIVGKEYGNVILRKEQYRASIDDVTSHKIAKDFILGKVYNSRWVLERATRDHQLRIDVEKFKYKSSLLKDSIIRISNSMNNDELRGYEGEAASIYFSVFDDLILQQKDSFFFHGRNKRPPLDSVNAMLSFAYTLLTGMTTSALESVGFDPFVGFMHTDRPGRRSLSLDLMEELRSVFADRFVLSLINKRIVSPDGFVHREDGAVIMSDESRSVFLKQWELRKHDIIQHPFIKEKIEWGLVPYVQAMLLARYIRGDLDEYPPFMWK